MPNDRHTRSTHALHVASMPATPFAENVTWVSRTRGSFRSKSGTDRRRRAITTCHTWWPGTSDTHILRHAHAKMHLKTLGKTCFECVERSHKDYYCGRSFGTLRKRTRSSGFASLEDTGSSTTPTMRALGWPCACVWLPGHWHDVNNLLGDFGGHGTRAWVAGKRRWEIHHSWIWDCPLLSRLSANEHLGLYLWGIGGHATAGNQGQARRLGSDKIFGLVGTMLRVAGDHCGSNSGGDKQDMEHQRKRGSSRLLRPPSSWRGRPRIATFRYATFHA